MAFNQQLYDRICNLKVYDTESENNGANGISIKQTDLEGLTFSSRNSDGGPGFRIKFNVKKVTGPVPVPNPAVIHIYNLSEDSRDSVQQLNNLVILEAGYGDNAQTLFEGHLTKGVTRKEGPDYVTEIQASDGIFAHQNSLINLSFGQSTTASTVATTLADALKGAGVRTGIIRGVPDTSYNKGIVLSGKTIDELKKFCDSNDLNWAIEDGKINIIPYGTNLDNPVIILSPSTGLIGIPEQREIDTNSASLISFKSLLNPQLGTFQLIQIISKFVNGFYTTGSITHTGDTYGTDWYTEGEAT